MSSLKITVERAKSIKLKENYSGRKRRNLIKKGKYEKCPKQNDLKEQGVKEEKRCRVNLIKRKILRVGKNQIR